MLNGKKGHYQEIDKVLCGNGGTTAFLNYQLSFNEVAIIIFPNVPALKSKQEAFQGQNIAFLYADSQHDINSKSYPNRICCTTDQFISRRRRKSFEAICEKSQNVYILIDEVHQTTLQNSFRSSLKDFINKVQEIAPNAYISGITATPLHPHEVDVKMLPSFTPQSLKVALSSNREDGIARVNKALASGTRVMVASNNGALLAMLQKNGVLRAKFKIGTALWESLAMHVKIIDDQNSDLVIISTAGTEGWDEDRDGKWHIYIFEDRSRNFETYTPQNIYQAIGRIRKGTIEHAEVITRAPQNRRLPSFSDIQDFINTKKLTAAQKQGKKGQDYLGPKKRHVLKYIDFVEGDEPGEWECNFKDYLYQLDKLHKAVDNGLSKWDKRFWAERGIEFYLIHDEPGKYIKGFPGHGLDTIQRHLDSNAQLIINKELYNDDFHIRIRQPSKSENWYENAKTALEIWRLCRRMNSKYLEEPYTQRAIDTLENPNQLIEKIKHHYQQHVSKKYGMRTKTGRNKLQILEEALEDGKKLANIIMTLGETHPRALSNKIASREYHEFTALGEGIIKPIAKEIRPGGVWSCDIKSAFSNFVHAANGKPLVDEDWYGESKKKKKSVNVQLNSIAYRPWMDTPRNKQYQRARKNLSDYGFTEDLTQWLMDTFFDRDPSFFFEWSSYHERRLIFRLVDTLNADAFIRRHDQVILFEEPLQMEIDSVKYLDQEGWFKMEAW